MGTCCCQILNGSKVCCLGIRSVFVLLAIWKINNEILLLISKSDRMRFADSASLCTFFSGYKAEPLSDKVRDDLVDLFLKVRAGLSSLTHAICVHMC